MRRLLITLGSVLTAMATLLGASAPAGAGGGLEGPSANGGRAAATDALSGGGDVGAAELVPLGAAGRRGPVRPDGLGRHPVGLTTVDMVDPARGDRTLTVDIWYPAARRADAPTAAIDLTLASVELPGVLAEPPVGRGSFPLVVFSHGNGGVRFQSWFLMQTLASHGFVVAAPDHTGNTAFDVLAGTADPLGVAANNRPRDVSFVIDEMLARDDGPASPFHRRIDERSIGVAGHSFGGFTALAMVAGFGDFAPDPRVDAIVPIAPAVTFSDEQLASIDVPTLLLGGTLDTTVPIEPGIARAWDLIPSRPSFRVDVQAAGHNSFTNTCDIRDAFVAAGVGEPILGFVQAQAAEGCAPELLPIDEAHRVTNLYAVSFLATELQPGARFGRFLTERYAERNDLPVELFARPLRGPDRAAA